MTPSGPLKVLPIACSLSATDGKAQVDRWRAFDEEYARSTERDGDRLTVHYARTDDAMTRLRELVATESGCCSFVTWNIDEDHAALRLVVTGTPEQLDALNVGHSD